MKTIRQLHNEEQREAEVLVGYDRDVRRLRRHLMFYGIVLVLASGACAYCVAKIVEGLRK